LEKITRGKVLEYLGMSIDYRQKGKVRLSMKEYNLKTTGGNATKYTSSQPPMQHKRWSNKIAKRQSL